MKSPPSSLPIGLAIVLQLGVGAYGLRQAAHHQLVRAAPEETCEVIDFRVSQSADDTDHEWYPSIRVRTEDGVESPWRSADGLSGVGKRSVRPRPGPDGRLHGQLLPCFRSGPASWQVEVERSGTALVGSWASGGLAALLGMLLLLLRQWRARRTPGGPLQLGPQGSRPSPPVEAATAAMGLSLPAGVGARRTPLGELELELLLQGSPGTDAVMAGFLTLLLTGVLALPVHVWEGISTGSSVWTSALLWGILLLPAGALGPDQLQRMLGRRVLTLGADSLGVVDRGPSANRPRRVDRAAASTVERVPVGSGDGRSSLPQRLQVALVDGEPLRLLEEAEDAPRSAWLHAVVEAWLAADPR